MIFWANLNLPTESISYTILYNTLNFPVGVVPVTTVTLQDQEELAFYKGYYGDSNDRNFPEVSFPFLTSTPCFALRAQTRIESYLKPSGPVGQGERGLGIPGFTLSLLLQCHLHPPEDAPFNFQVSHCPCQGRILYKNSGPSDISVMKVQSRSRQGGSGRRPPVKSLLCNDGTLPFSGPQFLCQKKMGIKKKSAL